MDFPVKDNIEYEVQHPITGNVELWTGERIRLYQRTYGGEVVGPPVKVKKAPEKKSEKVEEKSKEKTE